MPRPDYANRPTKQHDARQKQSTSKLNEKELEADASKKKRNQAVLGLTTRDSVPFKLSGDVAFAPLPTQGC